LNNHLYFKTWTMVTRIMGAIGIVMPSLNASRLKSKPNQLVAAQNGS